MLNKLFVNRSDKHTLEMCLNLTQAHFQSTTLRYTLYVRIGYIPFTLECSAFLNLSLYFNNIFFNFLIIQVVIIAV